MAFVDRRDPNDPDRLIGSWEEVPRRPVIAPRIGRMVYAARLRNEITLREVARLTTLTPAQVSSLEFGVALPSPAALRAVCECLGIEWRDMLGAAAIDGVSLVAEGAQQ